MATHWIDSATIDGFRNLRDLHLEGLGGVNIFVGENNSGKTSVLEALSILANYENPSEWLAMVARRDAGRLDESRVQSIRWCFERSRLALGSESTFDATCTFSCRGKLGIGELKTYCYDITATYPFVATDTADILPDELDVSENRRGLSISHHSTFKSNQPTLFPIPPKPIDFRVWEDDHLHLHRAIRKGRTVDTETLNPYSFQINKLQARRLSESKLNHFLDSTLELLKEFDQCISDIEIISLGGERPSIYLYHTRIGSAPLSVFGDALRRAVLLATTILSFEKGGILFIDEIETGIHVHALQRVFAWLSKVAAERNIQIFATTHSLEALDAIAFSSTEAKDRVVAFHLNQTPFKTTAKRFDGELLSRLRRERGLDVR